MSIRVSRRILRRILMDRYGFGVVGKSGRRRCRVDIRRFIRIKIAGKMKKV